MNILVRPVYVGYSGTKPRIIITSPGGARTIDDEYLVRSSRDASDRSPRTVCQYKRIIYFQPINEALTVYVLLITPTTALLISNLAFCLLGADLLPQHLL